MGKVYGWAFGQNKLDEENCKSDVMTVFFSCIIFKPRDLTLKRSGKIISQDYENWIE